MWNFPLQIFDSNIRSIVQHVCQNYMKHKNIFPCKNRIIYQITRCYIPEVNIVDSEEITYNSEMNLPLISGDIKVAFKSEGSLYVKVCEDNRKLNRTLV